MPDRVTALGESRVAAGARSAEAWCRLHLTLRVVGWFALVAAGVVGTAWLANKAADVKTATARSHWSEATSAFILLSIGLVLSTLSRRKLVATRPFTWTQTRRATVKDGEIVGEQERAVGVQLTPPVQFAAVWRMTDASGRITLQADREQRPAPWERFFRATGTFTHNGSAYRPGDEVPVEVAETPNSELYCEAWWRTTARFSYDNKTYNIHDEVPGDVAQLPNSALYCERVWRTTLDVTYNGTNYRAGGDVPATVATLPNSALFCERRWRVTSPFRCQGTLYDTGRDAPADVATLPNSALYCERRWRAKRAFRLDGRWYERDEDVPVEVAKQWGARLSCEEYWCADVKFRHADTTYEVGRAVPAAVADSQNGNCKPYWRAVREFQHGELDYAGGGFEVPTELADRQNTACEQVWRALCRFTAGGHAYSRGDHVPDNVASDRHSNCESVWRAVGAFGCDGQEYAPGDEVAIAVAVHPNAKCEPAWEPNRTFSYEEPVRHGQVAKDDPVDEDVARAWLIHNRTGSAWPWHQTRGPRPMRGLLVGKDGRWSTSKAQALMWTTALLFGLLSLYIAWKVQPATCGATASCSYDFGKLSLDDAYYLLLGGPFAAAVLAKAFTASKVAQGDVVKSDATGDGSLTDGLRDLVSNDEQRNDLIDTQYALFNLLALGYFFATLIPSLTDGLPVIPDALVGLTSASALAYITKKGVERSRATLASASPPTVWPGDRLELWGTNLIGGDGRAPSVQIGGFESPVVEVLTDPAAGTGSSHLRAAVPAGPQGAAKVTAIAAGGTLAESAVEVSVQHVAVTAVTPTPLPALVGTLLTITGAGFSPRLADNQVTLNGELVPLVTASATTLVAKLHAAPVGRRAELRVNVRASTVVQDLALEPAHIDEIQPKVLHGDQDFTVFGFGLVDGVHATLGGVDLVAFSADGGHRLNCTLPSGKHYSPGADQALALELPPSNGAPPMTLNTTLTVAAS